MKESDIREWDITKYVLPQHKELIMDLLNNKLLWERVDCVTDARMYMKMLSEDKNVDLYIVTDTSPQTTETKMTLLHKYYPYLNLDKKHVFITGNKQMVNVDLLIDDGQQNLFGGDYAKLLYTKPWNLNFNASKNGMIRCDNWANVYSVIQRKIESRKALDEIMN